MKAIVQTEEPSSSENQRVANAVQRHPRVRCPLTVYSRLTASSASENEPHPVMLLIDGIVFSLQRQGGISVYFHHLLRHLSDARQQVTCFVEAPSLQPVERDGQSVHVIERPARQLERYRHCRVPAGGSVFHSSYYRLPNRDDLPTILTVYDFIYERWYGGPRLMIHRAQKHKAIRAAQAVICISEATRDDLFEFVGEIPGQQVYVIPCGVSAVFRPVPLNPPMTPFVLYVGQRGGYKNFRQVLEAMRYLPDVELHCVGGGPIRRDEIGGVPDSVVRRVRHLGFLSDEALNIAYGSAICLAYPSRYEGFGIPVLEAMRAGCPVVSSECQAVLEVGRDALTVVHEPDPRAMADGILRTLSDDRPVLIQRGLARARERTWNAAHRQTLEVYRSVGGQFEPVS